MGLRLKKVNWRNSKLPSRINGNWYAVSEAIIRDKDDWNIKQYEDRAYKLIIENRFGVQIGIHLSTMTIQTVLNHPTSGKTQLTRKDITHKEFVAILANPRVHTGKGKYRNDGQSTARNQQARRNT